MAIIDVWITICHGATDTSEQDLRRVEKVFAGVPLSFRKGIKHMLSPCQTKEFIGENGKLAVTDGFDFTGEEQAVLKNWVDLGGAHIFYVPGFEEPSQLAGYTIHHPLHVGDPIIFINGKKNDDLLSASLGNVGVLEHEIGHALGLSHNVFPNTLMYETTTAATGGGPGGLAPLPLEMAGISKSRLLRVASALGERT
jgi:hypothetical protein